MNDILNKLAALSDELDGAGNTELANKVDELIKSAAIMKVTYIRHEKGKWNVYSKKGKHMGSYDTKYEAKKRLRQIEYFRNK